MGMIKCARCKNTFEKIRSKVCPMCLDDEDADFEKIRSALHDQPNMTLTQVAEAADVTRECVLRMLDEGMISNVKLDDDSIRCGMCGARAISATKKLCAKCLEKLDKQMAVEKSRLKVPLKKKMSATQSSGSSMGVRNSIEEKRSKK